MLIYWHVKVFSLHFPTQHLNGADGDALQFCPGRTQQGFVDG